MKHLSGLDAMFLYLETPEMPMHVGSLNLYELPPGYEGDFYEDLKAHVKRRMHLAPIFQRKLAMMPFELANPVWVDDDDIDLDYHVRRIVLKNGTMEQLEQYVGRLQSSLLDRSRPLWEFYVIEGLASGQIAFFCKLHHSGMDGAAGAALASAILDLTPEPRAVKAPRERNRSHQYQLGVAELAGAALSNTVVQSVKLIRLIPGIARAAAGAVAERVRERGKAKSGSGLTFGPKTPLNVSITNQRSFASLSIPLGEAREIAKRTGTSLNDVVLAISAGALRRYLADYDIRPAKPLLAAVPVSLREAGNTDMNNQVSMMRVSLATDIRDPLERLAAINASSTGAKALTGTFKAVIPTDFPSFGVPWIMSGLVSMYGRSRLANILPPVANVTISNVPGPQAPLYLAGARMVTYFPVSIPVHGLALNITVQSYNGSLDFGLTACRRALPDVKDLAGYMLDAHRELYKLSASLESAPAMAPRLASVPRPSKKPALRIASGSASEAVPSKPRASGRKRPAVARARH